MQGTRPHDVDVDVVVIGAGIAGLTALGALIAAGQNAICVEARDRVGGRLLSAPTAHGPLDLGATWFWSHERRVTRLVDDLDIDTFGQHIAGDALFDDGSEVRRFGGNPIDVPAYRFAAGAAALTDRLAAALSTDAVRLSTPVTALRADNGAGILVSTAEAPLRTRHVILAVPPALAVARIDLPPALPDSLIRLARSTPVWMGAVAKVVAQYPAPFWREDGLAGAAVSRSGPLQELHDMSGPGGSPAALFGFAPGASMRPGRNLADDAVSQLVRLFGPQAAAPRNVIVQDWSQETWTSPPRVHTQMDHSRFGHELYTRPALDGRLHWASTETSTEHAGHIAGAVAAGERAAAAVLDHARPTTQTTRNR